MTRFHKTKIALSAAVLCLFAPMAASAMEPVVQTKGTVIYLADNLNEEAKLGWCIDTEGKGLSDQLQAHSCKPAGGDTQFSYDTATSTIRSVPYENKCMAYSAPDDAEHPYGLLDCVDGDAAQKFTYDAGSMEIRIGSDAAKCVTVATTIIDAGPYQSRDLIVAQCADLDASYKQWVIRN